MHITFFNTAIVYPVLRFIAAVLLKCLGWKCVGEFPEQRKYMAIAAPHTSNWDFPIFLACALRLRLKPYWMGKDSLFSHPMGWFFRWLGGVAIDRSKSNNVVDQMVSIFEETDDLCLALAPEATRKRIAKWKSGFYHIAVQAEVPILLAYIDYEKKECGIGEFYTPTGDFAVDMKYIQEFYVDKVGRFPENFTGEFLED